MREIKCQVWDSINKKMLSWNDIGWMETNGKFSTHTSLSGQYANFTPRFFSGLKDKNGKDIYEGDIVDYRTYSRCDQPRQGLVFWDNDNGGYRIQRKGHEPMMRFHAFDAWVASQSEVIGNIYEHPQLDDQNPWISWKSWKGEENKG